MAQLTQLTQLTRLTHRDLAAYVQALYTAPASIPWLYRSNADANAVFGAIRLSMPDAPNAPNAPRTYLLVVFRGSYTNEDWLHDVLVRDVNPPGSPTLKRVHEGFYSGCVEATDILRLLAQPEDAIIVCGHSLGAARAEITAELLVAHGLDVPHVVLWGQPAPFKPSDMARAAFATVSYRNVEGTEVDKITHSTDLVGYRHRTDFTDLAVTATDGGLFALHHFGLYQSATPPTAIGATS